MLSDIMLSVIIMSVVAPYLVLQQYA